MTWPKLSITFTTRAIQDPGPDFVSLSSIMDVNFEMSLVGIKFNCTTGVMYPSDEDNNVEARTDYKFQMFNCTTGVMYPSDEDNFEARTD